MSKSNIERLKTLQAQEAFYFCDPAGNFTGHKACSLEEFTHQIAKVDLSSLEFHLYREDFEKWVAFSLKDVTLAKSMENLRKQKLCGEALRANLLSLLQKRLTALKKPAKTIKATVKPANTES